MASEMSKKWISWGILVLGAWIGARYLLPVALPFLIGTAIALAAEPGVTLLQRRFRWRRIPAVGLCVSLTLLLFVGLTGLVTAIIVKELATAAQYAPAVGEAVAKGMAVLQDWLIGLSDRAPENLRPVLLQMVLGLFQNGNALVSQLTERVPGMVTAFIGSFSRGALTVGTGILAGFMIAARMPGIQAWASRRLPPRWKRTVLPGIRRTKAAFLGWLQAQLKLMLVTWTTLTLGLFLLKVPYAPLWAGIVALVDAVPVLGTGTVLVPWSLVCFLQGNQSRGIGLLLLFAAAWITRSILEPRLVGKSLGLDPLLSLAAFYAGFRLWGIGGMILAPVAAAICKSILSGKPPENISPTTDK